MSSSPASKPPESAHALLEAHPSRALDQADADTLAEELAEELATAWHGGTRLRSEQLLDRHPALADHPEAFLRVLCEELCLRQEAGEEVRAEEFFERFPDWRQQLQALIDCHRFLLQHPLDSAQTEPLVDGFSRVAQLGQGAQGRVYLATQTSLADRPVVLKVIPWKRREHLSLSRLQHTHIVPLYWVQDDAVRQQRTLCMPYFGTLTLDMALNAMRAVPVARRTGRDFLDALDRAAGSAAITLSNEGPARAFLANASYTQALCWIGACLADALHYAHQRGLVHLDVKPSNVLLAADGQPMLLDFHVSQEPIRPNCKAPEWLGGTPAHMSPEQHAALRAVLEGRPVPDVVDQRSDIYALGLLLYRALGGEHETGGGFRRLDRCQRGVSVGLADVIHKSLAALPDDRYQDADLLAADLRHHLADLPLRGVPNRSWGERWRKWRRHQPQALSVILLLSVALATTALGVGHLQQQRAIQSHAAMARAQADLQEGKALLEHNEVGRAVATLERGLASAEQAGHPPQLWAALEDQLRPARATLSDMKRRESAADLNRLADRVRLRHIQHDLNETDLRELEQACQGLWDRRNAILVLSGARDDDISRQMEGDLLDVAAIAADVHVRRAASQPSERQQALQHALDILALAESALGPRHSIFRQRHQYAQELGRADLAQTAARGMTEVGPRTSWDHCALGAALYLQKSYARAAVHCRTAVSLAPQAFWPNYYQGLCAYRLRDYHEAVAAFRACISLSPGSAEPYYNRALAYTGLHQQDLASNDYDQVLRLDPQFIAAAVNRGILRAERKEYAQALADLRYALERGGDPAWIHYNAALIHMGQKDEAAALLSLDHALKSNPSHQEACALRDRLVRSGTTPTRPAKPMK